VVRREGHEVSSRRGNEPSRLQERTSAAESRTSLETLNWYEWNSCPSRLFFLRGVSFREKSRQPLYSNKTQISRFALGCER
jgi:hypothetical protein